MPSFILTRFLFQAGSRAKSDRDILMCPAPPTQQHIMARLPCSLKNEFMSYTFSLLGGPAR